MNVNLKILHLYRTFHYVPIQNPGRLDERALAELASQFGECLLVFRENNFSAMTDAGPRLSGDPVPAAAYRIAAEEGTPEFLLAAGDYVFFQWRAYNNKAEKSSPAFSMTLEEVVREIWWRRLECEGPWFLRLVSEDDRVAAQVLRELKKAP
jgi:hypothetical protein